MNDEIPLRRREQTLTSCILCPFYADPWEIRGADLKEGADCEHPDSISYSIEPSRNSIPEKCPLRLHAFTFRVRETPRDKEPT